MPKSSAVERAVARLEAKKAAIQDAIDELRAETSSPSTRKPKAVEKVEKAG